MATEQAKISSVGFSYPSPRRRVNWGVLAGVVCLVGAGFLFSSVVSGLAERNFQLSAGLVLVLILLSPAVIAPAVWIMPQAYRKLSDLRQQLHWWHWLWFLIYLSSLVFVKSDSALALPSGLTLVIRLTPEAIVLGVLLIRLTRRGPGWTRDLFRGLTGVLAVYALICAASAMWSVYPSWTLFKSLEYLLDISVLAAALANISTLEDYESVFNWVFAICGFEVLWVWLQFPLWPSDSFLDEYRLKGAWPQTSFNAVGQSGALLAVIALCRLLRPSGKKSDRGFYGALFLFGMATMLLAQTRSAIGGFLLAVVLVLLYARPKLAVLVAGLGGVVLVFTKASGIVTTFLVRGQSEESLHDLTGRGYFWSYAWELFSQHPFQGMGAYAAGRFLVQAKLHIFTATLHSDWVELLVGIGIVGLVPMALALLASWWFLLRGALDRTLDPQDRQLALEALGVLTIITVHSFFNDELIWHAPLYFLTVLGYAELLRRRNRRRTMHSPALAFAGPRPMSPSPR